MHRETLWKLLKNYGIPDKLVNLIKAMCRYCKCAVRDGAETSQWFEVKSGVKEGCGMSGFLFLVAMNWVMRRSIEGHNNWVMRRSIEGHNWKSKSILQQT